MSARLDPLAEALCKTASLADWWERADAIREILQPDLDHAEDTIRVALDALEHTAKDLHLLHARGSFDDCPKEACQRARLSIAGLEAYDRPSGPPREDDEGT